MNKLNRNKKYIAVITLVLLVINIVVLLFENRTVNSIIKDTIVFLIDILATLCIMISAYKDHKKK